MDISRRRRIWLQVGRLSVLGILAISGVISMNRQNLNTIYFAIAGITAVSVFVSYYTMRKRPSSRKPYWSLLVLDSLLLGIFIYISGGVDGPFVTFLLVHTLAYGFYLGPLGGLMAAVANILVSTFFSILALNVPGPGSSLSPLLFTLVQSGQLKISSLYITMRIILNGLLMVAAGLASGVLAQSLYTESGQLQRVLKNLTELRARSREILDSLHDGVVVVDPKGSVLSMNPAAMDLLGTGEPMLDSQLGKMVNDYRSDSGFPPVMDIVVNEKILECRLSRYGNEGSVIAILNDTTEVRNYKAALEERDKLSLIGRLSASMAHEIRNPLASMSGAAQMLATGTLTKEKAEQMATLVDKQARRVSELIEGYLSLSRSSRDFPFTKIDLNELVMDSVESAMHGFAGGVSLQFERSPEDPAVMGNRIRLGQVLWNLLRNSVEALSHSHEPLITLTTFLNGEEGNPTVTLEDNGPGIDPSIMDRIWEPFLSTRETGTGLGLYIVKRIVEEHNGKIDVENIMDGGARFTIRFPGTAR